MQKLVEFSSTWDRAMPVRLPGDDKKNTGGS